jgi:predicted ArsR family transcriptional regulator
MGMPMTADFELQSPKDVQTLERTARTRRTPIRAQIIDYLASNGASKVADISSGIASCRDSVRHHLAALESASIVRSNIAPGERGRFTPFYALAPGRTEPDS